MPSRGHMVGGEMSCICSRKLWRKGNMGLCFVPGTHPWLSHECPGYSTGVIRVLGHFDTRLRYNTHPHSTQHFNTSSTQTTGTGWENTDHSSDGFFVRNEQTYLEAIKMCITCMTSPHTARTYFAYHRLCSFTMFSQRILLYSRKCFFFSSLVDDNSKFRARRGAKSCAAGTTIICSCLNLQQCDDDPTQFQQTARSLRPCCQSNHLYIWMDVLKCPPLVWWKRRLVMMFSGSSATAPRIFRQAGTHSQVSHSHTRAATV